jgi:phosphoadenosine phosphosulfate reductase
MYSYEWDAETGGYLLNSTPLKFSKEPRPVYNLELDLLGFNRYWQYEDDDKTPLMWAEANNYWYRGRKIGMTRGGSLFTAPVIEVIEENPEGTGRPLISVDVSAMSEKNADIVETITNKTLKWIVKTYEDNLEKSDIFYVAYSGGKDSVVLLDLVQRALPHNSFSVVFGDTGMEFSDTYALMKDVEAELKSKEINYIKATNMNFRAEESWEIFGPPSQRMRWCCNVHKTVPQIIAIRKHLKKPDFRGVAFIGVRGDESASRSEYNKMECGKKHNGQCSAYPILEWNSAELYLYIFKNSLPINRAYKKGSSRVGCLVCPLAASKNEFIKYSCYPQETSVFLDLIRKSNFADLSDTTKIDDYLDYGGWKARRSGSIFEKHHQRYFDKVENSVLLIDVINANCDWKKWMPTTGFFEELGDSKYSVEHKGKKLMFTVTGDPANYRVTAPAYDIYSNATFFKFFKQAFKKAAYCAACGECEANCLNGCIQSVKNNIQIKNCTHCISCHGIENGCLLYHSHRKAKEGNMDSKSINRYGNLAPQTEWVEAFIKNNGEYAKDICLGTNKIKSLNSFLRDSGLMENKVFSKFAAVIKKVGLSNQNIGWALILANLAYSAEIAWFIRVLSGGLQMPRDEFEARTREQGDYDSKSQAPKHISAAFVILSGTPLGEVGLGSTTTISGKKYFSRSTWSSPEPRVILYSLYKFAEACDGYYQFTLSRLMDFSIDSTGISPAQVFGLSEDSIALIIRGLAAKYPEFISYSETLGLQAIDLHKTKSSVDVLELF